MSGLAKSRPNANMIMCKELSLLFKTRRHSSICDVTFHRSIPIPYSQASRPNKSKVPLCLCSLGNPGPLPRPSALPRLAKEFG